MNKVMVAVLIVMAASNVVSAISLYRLAYDPPRFRGDTSILADSSSPLTVNIPAIDLLGRTNPLTVRLEAGGSDIPINVQGNVNIAGEVLTYSRRPIQINGVDGKPFSIRIDR